MPVRAPKFTVKTKWKPRKIERNMSRAQIKFLFKAGAWVRTYVRRNFFKQPRKRKNQKNSSPIKRPPPGQPPGSPTGALKNSILFQVKLDKRDVIIGPSADKIEQVGALHEFGGRHPEDGRRIPERPFMRPALAAVEPELDNIWLKSVQETS